jgi:hypothetical protein
VERPLLPLILLTLASCSFPQGNSNGSSGSPAAGGKFNAKPVIDAVSLPEGATPVGSVYLLQGSISCHDDDDAVHAVNVRIPAIGHTVSIPAGDRARIESEPLTVQLPTDIPLGGRGATELDVTVVDTQGAESDPKALTVVLQ